MNKMFLYYFPSCPFCVKVLNAIDELGIDGIELRDKHVEPRYADELQAATGTTMQASPRAAAPIVIPTRGRITTRSTRRKR